MPGPHRNRERSPTSSPGGSPSPPPRAEVAASAVVPEPAPAEGGDTEAAAALTDSELLRLTEEERQELSTRLDAKLAQAKQELAASKKGAARKERSKKPAKNDEAATTPGELVPGTASGPASSRLRQSPLEEPSQADRGATRTERTEEPPKKGRRERHEQKPAEEPTPSLQQALADTALKQDQEPSSTGVYCAFNGKDGCRKFLTCS